MNKFVDEDHPEKLDLMHIDEVIGKQQIDKLKKVKAERDNEEVKHDLDALKKAAEGTDNMLPYILKCVESYCSIGEISNTLRGVWGEY